MLYIFHSIEIILCIGDKSFDSSYAAKMQY